MSVALGLTYRLLAYRQDAICSAKKVSLVHDTEVVHTWRYGCSDAGLSRSTLRAVRMAGMTATMIYESFLSYVDEASSSSYCRLYDLGERSSASYLLFTSFLLPFAGYAFVTRIDPSRKWMLMCSVMIILVRVMLQGYIAATIRVIECRNYFPFDKNISYGLDGH